MPGFEVFVNGERVCMAGIESALVLSVGIAWTHRNPEMIHFNLGGLSSVDPREHIGWNTPQLKVGDEVTIRLVEGSRCDEPDTRRLFQRDADEGRPG